MSIDNVTSVASDLRDVSEATRSRLISWSTSIDGRRLAVDTFDTDAALARCLAYVGVPPAQRAFR